MDKDISILGLRIIGGIGTLLLAWELRGLRKEIKRITDEALVDRITRKVYLFFLIFGAFKMIAIIADTMGANGMAGALVNNVLVYWLVRYADRQRHRLRTRDFDTESRGKISASLSELVDEMKVHSRRIAEQLGT